KMLGQFPAVKSWEDTHDVMQNSLLRLLRSLRELRPNSTREFFGLASEQIRRELLDLVKHYRAQRRSLDKPQALVAAAPIDASALELDPADPAGSGES